MEDQENQQNQENKEQDVGSQIIQAGKERIKQAAKDEAIKATKKAAKATAKAAAKLTAKIFAIIAPYIAIILAVVITAMSFYAVVRKVVEIVNTITTSLQSFVQIGDNGPIAPSPKEMIELINKSLEENGIKKEDLDMGSSAQREAYLYKFMSASLATQLPYIKDSTAQSILNIAESLALNSFTGPANPLINLNQKQEVQGIVKIKRRTGNATKELTFKKYEDFSEMISNGNKNAVNYFSIDENWMLCVAKNNETVTTAPDGDISNDNKVEEVKIPYQTMISKYSVPFEYFIALQQITRKSRICISSCRFNKRP